MSSVTDRIKQIKQPYGGYLKPSAFAITEYDEGEFSLSQEENIHGSIVGMVVDYLTRMELGEKKEVIFNVAMRGAFIAENTGGMKKASDTAIKLLKGIDGLNKSSIINACKLSSFDVWGRNPMAAMMANSYETINPDDATIRNILILTLRSVIFLKEQGPIIKTGFTFEPSNYTEKDRARFEAGKGCFGGYTQIVNSGDGDYLTKDTLWDFKVAKSKPNSKNTLQILMYWIMGQHSGQEAFKSVTKIGIFNPRIYVEYVLDISRIPKSIIETVEKQVICY